VNIYQLLGFLVFFLGFSSCAAQHVESTEFYKGLKKRHEGAPAEAAVCFAQALNAANTAVAAAAAAELINVRADGAELSAETAALIRQKADGSWARALDVFTADNAAEQGGVIDREKLLALLLNGDSRAGDEAVSYVLRQWRMSVVDSAADGDTSGATLTQAENAAVDGRIAASHSRYSEALTFFRVVLHDSPDLFFRYPDLLTDLGRSFQYAGAGREGIDLFLQWETMLNAEGNAAKQGAKLSPEATLPEAALKEFIPAGSENPVRFRLLFFAARMARQRGEKNIELFEKALPYALEISPEQADACIWYIVDSSFAQGVDTAIRSLETYVSRWHDDAYFSDVLDKLARELVFRRQWEKIFKVFTLLRNRPGAIAAPLSAHYAWIIGRVIEEGFFAPEKTARGDAPVEKFAPEYMRIAYNATGNTASVMPLYYRSLSADTLGETFLVLSETAPAAIQPAQNVSDTMQFLLGFFENDAAQFAPRYIRAAEGSLSPEELRRLAEALGAAGQYQESMRLVSLYAHRSGYRLTRHDLELLYPRPFKELVEQYARETGIDPALLFGLIRTESAFDPGIVSRAGAVGLTQLMPATAAEMAVRIRRRGGPDYTHNEDSAIDLSDPAVNIHIGAVYLAYLNERMEDPLLALLAYNGGMNRIRRWRRTTNRFFASTLSSTASAGLPPDLFLETVEYPETRNYGRSVMGAAAMYTALYF
jgi:soluble lytic murein transglycosylase